MPSGLSLSEKSIASGELGKKSILKSPSSGTGREYNDGKDESGELYLEELCSSVASQTESRIGPHSHELHLDVFCAR